MRGRSWSSRWSSLREFPITHPFWVVLLVALSLVPSALWTSRLEIRSSLSELLPQSRPSVVELERTKQRLAGISTLIVVLTGRDADSLVRAVDALAPGIRALGPRFVTGVDSGGAELEAFLRQHQLLYADLSTLRELRDEIVERHDFEVARRSGFDFALDDEEPPRLTVEEIRARFARRPDVNQSERPGYYIGEGGRIAAIVVRTPFESGDARAFELERRIRDLFAGSEPSRRDPTLRVHFTGSLVTSAEEHRAVKTDLAHVGTAGVLLILGIVYSFFLRARAIVAMLLTIGTGCVWSFGVAYLLIGHLNSASGFLVSIIAGDGINFGIVLMARYIEARLRDRASLQGSLRIAMGGTVAGTLTAALCSSVAYASLAATDFRGFRHFGLIAGIGMVLCWIASYTLLPALLVIGEKIAPLRVDASRWRMRLRGLYGRPFAYVAKRLSRPILVVGLLSGVASAVIAAVYLARDPLEYDMRKLRIDDSEPTSARKLARRVEKFVGRLRRDGQAILVERVDQVAPVLAELERRRVEAPEGQKPFERTVTAFDLLPQQQDEKLALVSEIKARLTRARELGMISDDEWAKLAPELPQAKKLGIEDLPSEVAWPFQEADGTRGRVIYLVPTQGRGLNDARYLMQWANSFREVKLPDGEVVRGTGQPVLVADMLESIRTDAPKALGLALVATFLVVFIAFGGRSAGLMAFGSFVLGLVWLVAFLAVSGSKINFMNFVALPISVGVGADYAVNLMSRYESEGARGMGRVLEETGSAVVVCSLTTLFGYAALTLSDNGAVRSFGVAAAVGELSMLFAAILVMPAALTLREWRAALRRRLARRKAQQEGHEGYEH